jgi:hypothetical protein
VKTITVTWMNGECEVYRVQNIRDEGGILTLSSPNEYSQPDRHIPLANVRIWTVER